MNIKPYSRRVYYYETDRMGIVHHSNYIRWMEEARVYCLEQAGMPFDVIESKGVMMPVLSVSCTYKQPFTFNDIFYIECHIPRFRGSRFEVNYVITDENGVVRSEGISSHCFADMQLRPIRINKAHPDIYEVFASLSDTTD